MYIYIYVYIYIWIYDIKSTILEPCGHPKSVDSSARRDAGPGAGPRGHDNGPGQARRLPAGWYNISTASIYTLFLR